MQHTPEFLKAIVFVIPFILLQFVGFVLSLFWRARLDRAWISACLGFLLLLTGNIGTIVYFVYLFLIYDSTTQGTRLLEIAGMVQSGLQSGLGTLGYLLLITALFIRREPIPSA